MKIIGLTGGIAMGKSTSARLLGERRLPVVDTDDLAREVAAPGQPALARIVAAFGSQMLASDGSLRRDELARIVFADESRRKQLEAILHPPIRERWLSQVEAWKRENRPLGVIVIPLLFETGAEKYFDRIVCAACSSKTQLARLATRNWTSEQSLQRIQSQWPVEKKIALSNFVVWTEGALEVHARQWDLILRDLSRPNLT
jgi:dephospho-CoA kinase